MKPTYRIMGILLSILLFFVFTELGLRVIDPFGTQAGPEANRAIYGNAIQTAHGFTIAPGKYHFRHWSMTVLEDGTRALPATRVADCTIAFIGDSVMFGYGVSDAATFANLIAAQFTGVHFINAARPAYNIEHISYLPQDYPANGYIWLVFVNDASGELPDSAFRRSHPSQLAMRRATLALMNDWQWGHDWSLFHRYADALFNREDTLTFSFANTALEAELPASVIRIPTYTDTVSLADNHPSVAAHHQIAEAMYPTVQNFVNRICHEHL